MGDIICCLDESGSTEGEAAAWGKAVAMTLLEIAAESRRSLALIHFAGSSSCQVDIFRPGEYTLEEYWEPSDGSYSDDIRAKFPADAADEALNDQAYIDDLKAACDQKALEARSAAAN